MDLEHVIDFETGLKQDTWSSKNLTFGKHNQLRVVGYSGHSSCASKYYILKCDICSQDNELHGGGYFRSNKGGLLKGNMPCGCGASPRWTQDQFRILCTRAANQTKNKFVDFILPWKGNNTKIVMLCEKHGEWRTGNINSLIVKKVGCPACRGDAVSLAKKKPEKDMILSFMETGCFTKGTHFTKSSRLTSQGQPSYWLVDCPECGQVGESTSNNLQQGKRPCACSGMRQTEAYINIVEGNNSIVAIKFGIANNSTHRVKNQNRSSIYNIYQYAVYRFPTVDLCKRAERECRTELDCGVVEKLDMKDGYTETTDILNLWKIIAIYERNGGNLHEVFEIN